MTLEEAEALFQSWGLYARCLGNDVLRVARRIAPRSEDIPILEEASGIHREAGAWHFSHWTHAPGPGPHDVDYTARSLDEAVDVALRWYFGEPLHLVEWTLPLHQHPEWDAAKLERVVLGARLITPEAWRRVREEAHTVAKNGWVYPEPRGTRPFLPYAVALSTSFIPFPHPREPYRTLWLRRDLEAAFLVDK